jgi:hypothetical protein
MDNVTSAARVKSFPVTIQWSDHDHPLKSASDFCKQPHFIAAFLSACLASRVLHDPLAAKKLDATSYSTLAATDQFEPSPTEV